MARHREVEDATLAAALTAGDVSALGELYDRHAEGVRRFVLRAGSSVTDADDLVHDTFLALFDGAGSYDASRPMRAFLLGIAGKLLLRRRRSVFSRLALLARFAPVPSEPPSPEDLAAGNEAAAHLGTALRRLSAAKRVTFVLADIEGLSGPEVANALGVPVATVWTRLHFARAELRAVLSRRGGPRP